MHSALQDISTLLSLKGRTALISGGASGIGAAAAKLTAAAGASVFLMDTNEKGMQQTAASIEATGGHCMFTPGDVRHQDDCRNAVGRCLQEAGVPTMLVNAAGVIVRKDVLALTEE